MVHPPFLSRTPRTIIYLDKDQETSREFREILASLGSVIACHDLHSVLSVWQDHPEAMALFDTDTLRESPTGLVSRLTDFRGKRLMALVTGERLENYIDRLRHWGLTQVFVKQPPVSLKDIDHFLRMVENPASGFGLISYLASTVEMYSLSVNSLDSKTVAIERVMDHFSGWGFNHQELYDVRLILEETINNAIFHAFQTAEGEEKYTVRDFDNLAPEESVRVEYGSDSTCVGFSITDNAGVLPIRVILQKLERQLNQDGVFEDSGRGLYLSRMLSTRMIINIEHKCRTQVIVMFDRERGIDRPKPFVINYQGPDDSDEWTVDPEMD